MGKPRVTIVSFDTCCRASVSGPKLDAEIQLLLSGVGQEDVESGSKPNNLICASPDNRLMHH